MLGRKLNCDQQDLTSFVKEQMGDEKETGDVEEQTLTSIRANDARADAHANSSAVLT